MVTSILFASAAALSLSISAVAASPNSELDKIAASLSSRAQLNVAGEQAQFASPNAKVARQFDTFSLKFDRPTKRLRLSYSRFQNQSLRIDVEAWGTLDCLNMLRWDKTPPGLIQPRMQSCANFGSLYSVLSENSQGYAPQLIMLGEIESQMIAHDVNYPHMHLEVSKRPHAIVLTGNYDNIQHHVWHYWLNAEGTALEHFDVDNDSERVRATYRHSEASFTDADFNYSPDVETLALLAFAKDPKGSAHGTLKQLASHGSMAAKLQLKITEPSMMGLMFGAPSESAEQAWKNSTELGQLGMSSMYTAQGRVLVRIPQRAMQYLPKRFQSMPPEQRKREAGKLVWQGVQGCDPEAFEEARSGFLQGSDIFDPNELKLTELDAIKRECGQRMTASELTKAAALFEPWPTLN
jgi:hypothetical protein